MNNRSGIDHRIMDVGDDLRLHVATSGNGSPVVLLHGFTGSTETWTPLREQLEKSHCVIAIDFAGHGRSTAPTEAGRYALDRFGRDLALVFDELSINRAAVLGYSMGGRAGLRFALSHADRVAALILESTSPGISDESRRAERLVADGALAESIERDGIEVFVARWEELPLWESQSALSEAARARLRAQRLNNDPTGLANSLRGAGAGAALPVTDRLAEIAAPTLLVTGALDLAYVELGRLMHASIPGSRMGVVPDAGHTVHLEQPAPFAAAVHEFLKDTAPN